MKKSLATLLILVAGFAAPAMAGAAADVVHPDAFGTKVSGWWQSATAGIERWRLHLRGSIETEQTRVREKEAAKPAPEPIPEEVEKPSKPGVEIEVSVNPGFDVEDTKATAQTFGTKLYLALLSVGHTIISTAFLFYGLLIAVAFVILRGVFRRAAPHVGSWE